MTKALWQELIQGPLESSVADPTLPGVMEVEGAPAFLPGFEAEVWCLAVPGGLRVSTGPSSSVHWVHLLLSQHHHFHVLIHTPVHRSSD